MSKGWMAKNVPQKFTDGSRDTNQENSKRESKVEKITEDEVEVKRSNRRKRGRGIS
jgi:hypothetical protein